MLCTRGNVKLHIFQGKERISFLYSEQQKGDWLTTNIAEKKLVLMRQKKKQFRQIFGQIGFEIGNKLLLEDTSQSFIIYWLQVQLAPKTANLFRFEGPILYFPVLQVEEPGFWLEPHCLNSFARFSLRWINLHTFYCSCTIFTSQLHSIFISCVLHYFLVHNW